MIIDKLCMKLVLYYMTLSRFIICVWYLSLKQLFFMFTCRCIHCALSRYTDHCKATESAKSVLKHAYDECLSHPSYTVAWSKYICVLGGPSRVGSCAPSKHPVWNCHSYCKFNLLDTPNVLIFKFLNGPWSRQIFPWLSNYASQLPG